MFSSGAHAHVDTKGLESHGEEVFDIFTSLCLIALLGLYPLPRARNGNAGLVCEEENGLQLILE